MVFNGANQIWHPMPCWHLLASKSKNLQLCNYMGVSLIGFVVYDSYRFVTSTTQTKFQDPRIIFPGCLTLIMSGFVFVCFHIERYSYQAKYKPIGYIIFSKVESWLPKVIAWDPSESWLDELQRHRAWRCGHRKKLKKKTDPWPALRSFGMGGSFGGKWLALRVGWF